MGLLFVTHDLGVVAEIADRVVVMYAGKVMERGDVEDVFADPSHPYTRALLRCLPGRGRAFETIGGTLPDPTDPPAGCRFHPRCPHAVDACRSGDQPGFEAVGGGTVAGDIDGDDHEAACLLYGEDQELPGDLAAPIAEVDDA